MRSLAVRSLFALTVCSAAGLVFLVQPMVARQLLPVFGGSPAVWNTCVVFFQFALLAGYAVAHLSIRALGPRRQAWVQLGLVAVAAPFLPFAVRAEAPPSSVPPTAWIGFVLLIGVGIPYIAVSSASPVLQRWYAAAGQSDSADPYFLYTASNAGSLIGLLAFPFLLEPRLDTSHQELTWAIVFAVYALGLIGCALVVRRRSAPDEPTQQPSAATDEASATGTATATTTATATPSPIGWRRATWWMLVAALPASLMLGATTYITKDVTSAPLLWVIPIAIYLVSFMITFGKRLRVGPRVAAVATGLSVTAVLLVDLERLDIDNPAPARVVVHLLALLSASTLAHATLYAERPPSEQLTNFYLLLSIGGAIGGAFTALVAPVWFNDVYEYPLLLAAALALRPTLWAGPRRARESGWLRAVLTIAELVLACLLVLAMAGSATDNLDMQVRFGTPFWLAVVTIGLILLQARRWGLVLVATCLLVLLAVSNGTTLYQTRNFFGTLNVESLEGAHRLMHGTTLHGAQIWKPVSRRMEPTSYYTKKGPIGDMFDHLQRKEPFDQVGIVGLGSGAIAGYGKPGQDFTFFEIDPAVIHVARDPKLFTWLRDTKADIRVVEGDARLELAKEPDGRYDMLVLDAYASDAVPVHLMTVEAFRMYLDKLAPHGRIAVHISSRNLDLRPVVSSITTKLGLAAGIREDRVDTLRTAHDRANSSRWIVIARDDADLESMHDVKGWSPLGHTDPDDAWTDDYSDIASTIIWLPWNK